MSAKTVQPSRTNPATGLSVLKNATCIQKLLLKPSDSNMIPLGSYDEQQAPKVMVELEPNTNPSDSIVTVITRDKAGGPSLFLHIANHGLQPVNAGVWQL